MWRGGEGCGRGGENGMQFDVLDSTWMTGIGVIGANAIPTTRGSAGLSRGAHSGGGRLDLLLALRAMRMPEPTTRPAVRPKSALRPVGADT